MKINKKLKKNISYNTLNLYTVENKTNDSGNCGSKTNPTGSNCGSKSNLAPATTCGSKTNGRSTDCG